VLQAIRTSQAKVADSIETKTALLLHLLNDTSYLIESSPDPRYGTAAKFTSTPYADSVRLIERYSKGSSGGPFDPYDLDSARTPAEMMSQRIGGDCGTHARVFAELIQHLGIPASDLRIVSAVCTQEYDRFCAGGRGSKADPTYRGGASGHVFVLLKVGGAWKLVNTTLSPLRYALGPHAKGVNELATERSKINSQKTSDLYQAHVAQLIRKMDFSDLEAAGFIDPDAIQSKLGKGEGVRVPEFKSLPEVIGEPQHPVQFRNMTIFDVSLPQEYPLHKFKDRVNFIASGKLGSDVCRFPVDQRRPNVAPNADTSR
jgi:hypothetical protein